MIQQTNIGIKREKELLEIKNEELIKLLKGKDKEIERLNKELDKTRLSELHKEYIINELETYLQKHYEEWKDSEDTMLYSSSQEDKEILDLLEYLKYKDSDKE